MTLIEPDRRLTEAYGEATSWLEELGGEVIPTETFPSSWLTEDFYKLILNRDVLSFLGIPYKVAEEVYCDEGSDRSIFLPKYSSKIGVQNRKGVGCRSGIGLATVGYDDGDNRPYGGCSAPAATYEQTISALGEWKPNEPYVQFPLTTFDKEEIKLSLVPVVATQKLPTDWSEKLLPEGEKPFWRGYSDYPVELGILIRWFPPYPIRIYRLGRAIAKTIPYRKNKDTLLRYLNQKVFVENSMRSCADWLAAILKVVKRRGSEYEALQLYEVDIDKDGVTSLPLQPELMWDGLEFSLPDYHLEIAKRVQGKIVFVDLEGFIPGDYTLSYFGLLARKEREVKKVFFAVADLAAFIRSVWGKEACIDAIDLFLEYLRGYGIKICRESATIGVEGKYPIKVRCIFLLSPLFRYSLTNILFRLES